MLDVLPAGVQVWEAIGEEPGDLVLRWANPAATAHTGFAVEELVGRRIVDVFPASLEAGAWWHSLVLRALRHQEPADFVQPYRDQRIEGWFRVQVRPLGGRRGLVAYEKVTEERAQSQALQASERLNASILASLQEGIVVIDTSGRVTRANEAAAEMMGCALGELVGSLVRDVPIEILLPDGSPMASEDRPVLRALRGETVTGVLVQVCRHDGTVLWAEVESKPLSEPDGTPYGALSTYVDVTDRMARERRMREEADSDPLTGLPNRRALDRMLDASVERARHGGREVGVVMIDLDGFKALNDRWGHPAGDGALRSVADRLRRAVRERDLVARLGGDEFVIVLGDLQDAGAAVADCCERVAAALSVPLRFEGGSAEVAAAQGRAVFPRDGGSPQDLLAHADRAMYASKSR
jgi:diguanylate cyclase (GGDEF)-like protein/PAS domain S-box-containing protein